LETQGLKDQAAAALQGGAALEAWQVQEAGRQALTKLGIQNIEDVTGKVRDYAQAAVDAAEAAEKQKNATQKAIAVGSTLMDLQDQINAENKRTLAIRGGSAAEVEYARDMAITQAVQKAGRFLTEDE